MTSQAWGTQQEAGEPPRRRRGRPERLPEDLTPLTSRTVDVAARTAWLLATNRRLAADPALRDRGEFVRRLQAAGAAVDGYRLSRWESGNHPVPRAALHAYAAVLGRPRGSFVALADGLTRAVGGGSAVPPARPAPDEAHLDRLLETVLTGRPSGGDWLDLAHGSQAWRHVWLPSSTWQELARRLVLELDLAVGPALRLRHEAASVLLDNPLHGRHVVRAVGELVLTPDAQVVEPALALLAEVPSRASNDVVLKLATAGPRQVRDAALAVLADKVARGHYHLGELQAIARIVPVLTQQGGRDALLDGTDLVCHLPASALEAAGPDLTHPAMRDQLAQARSTGELRPASETLRAARALASAVQAAVPASGPQEVDPVLVRLLREALFHPAKVRRHLAAEFLAASPYAAALAAAGLVLARDRDEFVAARAWTLLRHLSDHASATDLADTALDEHRPALASRALTTLGAAPDRASTLPVEDPVSGLTGGERPVEVQEAAMTALGLRGSERLRGLADEGPARQRAAATWWIRVGPAVRDRQPGLSPSA